jgi:hypothetical protein
VFLLGGQSNALGRAPSSGLPTTPVNLQQPQDDVLFYFGSTLTTLRPGSGKFTSEFGPEVTFGRTLADAYPASNFAIIKYAAGGTNLYSQWAPPSGAQYIAFRNTVTNGLAALQAAGHTTEIVGMVWHQGESDALNNQHEAYEGNLTAFIADMRTHYGANLSFLIGEIRWDEPRNGPEFKVVSDAQAAVAAADPNAAFAPANDLTFSDRFHFDAAGQKTLGERLGSSYVALLNSADDTTSPTLAGTDIVDDRDGSPVAPGVAVTYTVTFSEDIDHTTVSAADFDNAGTTAISVGTIDETSPGVFTVAITPSSVGTLQLQIPASAVITDNAANALDAGSDIMDDTIISVEMDNTLPTVATFANDVNGGPIFESHTVTYTVTFSEAMDAATLGADDFENASATAASIDSVSATGNPAVFEVAATPSETGTLQLQVKAGAILTDAAGNELDTTSAIPDTSIITVDSLPDVAEINVNLLRTGAQSTVVNPGYGLWAQGGNTWNTGALSSGTSSSYVDSGGNATAVALTLAMATSPVGTNANGSFGPDGLTGAGTYGGNGGGVSTATISGLDMNQAYELLFYHAKNNVNETETANGVAPEDFTGSTTAANSSVYEDGFDTGTGHFNYYSSVSADGGGNIVISMEGSGHETVTGFQIRSVANNNTFTNWIGGFPGLGGLTDFTDDSDGDQLANGLEAWFGTDPGAFDAGLTNLATDGTATTFSHPQNEDPPSDVTGFYQWSINLTDWYAGDGMDGPPGGPIVTMLPNTVGTTTTVTATASEVLKSLFLRVGVVQD